jgi:hypothetical protein
VNAANQQDKLDIGSSPLVQTFQYMLSCTPCLHPAGLHASQVATEAPVIHNNPRRFLPRQLSDSTADISSCDDAENHEAQPPSTKRQRSDSITAELLVAQAQHALAAVMAQKQQQTVSPTGALASPANAAAAAAIGPFSPSYAMRAGLPPVVPLAGHRAASLNDMMEAAEILTAFTAPSLFFDTQSPVSQEAYTDSWDNSMALDDQDWTGADEEWIVPEFTVGASRPAAGVKPAPKPRKKATAAAGGAARQPGKARKVADKRNTTHVSASLQAQSCCLPGPCISMPHLQMRSALNLQCSSPCAMWAFQQASRSFC